MAMAGDALMIQVYDHVILTDKAYFSFKEARMI